MGLSSVTSLHRLFLSDGGSVCPVEHIGVQVLPGSTPYRESIVCSYIIVWYHPLLIRREGLLPEVEVAKEYLKIASFSFVEVPLQPSLCPVTVVGCDVRQP